ncbi:MAG: hypothetical protein P0111_02890 [Nitrospira sp.]|nr:hypothetical protein [Nitrospira sp.]
MACHCLFLFPEGSWEAANRNECLDRAGAECLSVFFDGNSHGSAGQRPVVVETAEAFGTQRGTWSALQPGDQSIDFGIGELIDERRLSQRRGRDLEDGGLLGGDPLNVLPFMLFESGEPFMESVDIEHGNGERADTTMGTAGSTGDCSEQSSLGPLKPAVGPALE